MPPACDGPVKDVWRFACGGATPSVRGRSIEGGRNPRHIYQCTFLLALTQALLSTIWVPQAIASHRHLRQDATGKHHSNFFALIVWLFFFYLLSYNI